MPEGAARTCKIYNAVSHFVFRMQEDEAHVHTVFVVATEGLAQGFGDAAVEFGKNDFRLCDLVLVNDLVQEVGSEDTHKHTRNAMSRAINSRKKRVVRMARHPTKIARDDVPRLVVDEMRGQIFLKLLGSGHDGLLDAGGIADGIFNFVVLLLQNTTLQIDFI